MNTISHAGLQTPAASAGESPTAHLPLLYLPGSSSSSQPLLETFAILRRLAKRAGQYGDNEEQDYMADMAADATVEFRWVCMLVAAPRNGLPDFLAPSSSQEEQSRSPDIIQACSPTSTDMLLACSENKSSLLLRLLACPEKKSSVLLLLLLLL
jgi:hypothetical protein